MHLFLVNLYAFGEVLRILLWISLPVLVLLLLITTWFSYKNKNMPTEGLLLADGPAIGAMVFVEGQAADPGRQLTGSADAEQSGKSDGEADVNRITSGDKGNMYKAILWLKDKYENYREMADLRYERVKEELVRSEKKYEDLVITLSMPSGEGESVGALKAQLQAEKQKVAELVAKLQTNTELLMNIYKELDKSFYTVGDRP